MESKPGQPTAAAQRMQAWAWLCVLLMVAVVALSAFLRHDAAGLGCVPWPVCLGRGGSAAGEWAVSAARAAHRAAASGVLVLAIVLCALHWRRRGDRRRELRLSLALLGIALALSALGLVTPGSRLPGVAMANLAGGFAMLGVALRLAAGPAGLGLPAWGVAMAVGVQALIGGFVSASHAGTACTDLAGCWQLATQAGWGWEWLDPTRVQRAASAVPDAGAAVAQFVHRVGALVVAPAVAALACWAYGCGRRRSGLLLAALLASQVAIGLIAGGGDLPLAAVLLHNLGSALMLALVLRLA